MRHFSGSIFTLNTNGDNGTACHPKKPAEFGKDQWAI